MQPWKALRLAFAAALIFSHTSLSRAHATHSATDSDIRVRVDRVSRAFTLTGMGLRYPGSPVSVNLGFRALRVSWTKAPRASYYQWIIEDRDSGELLARFHSRKLEIAGMSMRVNLRSVPDRLTFFPVRAGADLVATMDIESYLKGVLPSEMPAKWPLESLKAQAVAARSYALYKKSLRGKNHYDVESDVMDQVFVNPLGVSRADSKTANIERALRETRGVVLVDRLNQPLPSYFHADCGGRTEEAQNVWGGGEKTGTAIDESCPLNPAAKWRVSLATREIANRLRPGARLAAMEILERSESGRVARLKFRWADDEETVLTGHEFRMSLGHERIKSTNFDFVKQGSQFEISGQGFGHGAGLCQWGAKKMAMKGSDYLEILQHYYPKASLKEPARL